MPRHRDGGRQTTSRPRTCGVVMPGPTPLLAAVLAITLPALLSALPDFSGGCAPPSPSPGGPGGPPPALRLRAPATAAAVAEFLPGARHGVEVTAAEGNEHIRVLVSVGTLYDDEGVMSPYCGGTVVYLGGPGGYPAAMDASGHSSFSFAWAAPDDDRDAHFSMASWPADADDDEEEEAAVSVETVTIPSVSSAPSVCSGVEEVCSVGLFVLYISIILMASQLVVWRQVVVNASHSLVNLCLEWPFRWVRVCFDVGDVVLAALTLITGAVYLICGGQRAAAVGWLACFFLTIALLPTGQHSQLTPMLQMAFRHPMRLHRLGAYGFCFMLGAHIGFALYYSTSEVVLSQMSNFHIQGSYNYSPCVLSGVIGSCLFGTAVVLGWAPISRWLYKLFYLSHFLIILGTIFTVLHCPKTVWLVLCALVAWVLDTSFRAYQTRTNLVIARARTLPCNALEIQVAVANSLLRSFHPGQYVLMRLPEVSKSEWVPLSVAGGPGELTASFIVKLSADNNSWASRVRALLCDTPKDGGNGTDWSDESATIPVASSRNAIVPYNDVEAEIGAAPSPESEGSWLVNMPPVAPTGHFCNIHGPFGCLGADPLSHKVLLLVSGGVGVTPMMSICEYVLSRSDEEVRPHVHFVWMAREQEMFSGWCPKLLSRLQSDPKCTLHLYHTKGLEQVTLPVISGEESITVHEGRCNVYKLFNASAMGTLHSTVKPSQVGVYCCGPEELQDSVCDLAEAGGYHMHREA